LRAAHREIVAGTHRKSPSNPALKITLIESIWYARLPTFPALPHFAEISDIAALKFWQLEQMPKPSTMVVRRNKLALSLIRKIGTEGRGVSVEKHGQSNATDRPPTPCEIATTYAELRTPISDGALGLFRLERHPTNLYRLIAVVGSVGGSARRHPRRSWPPRPDQCRQL
jgi:hypothetical protein